MRKTVVHAADYSNGTVFEYTNIAIGHNRITVNANHSNSHVFLHELTKTLVPNT